jgi:protein-S-isoprenylcysteine O-methyltransferase Ste14
LFGIYLFSFFALSLVAAKQSGRRIWLLGEGLAVERISAAHFRLAFGLGAVWPLVRALGLDPLGVDAIARVIDGNAADLVGHLLVTLGACVAVLGQVHMGQSWRIGTAEGQLGPIVDTGPFAVSRNPVFLGHILLFTGLFLVFPSVVQLGITLVLIAAIRIQVHLEEQTLTKTLGDKYLAYARRVRRWIGTYPSDGRQQSPVDGQH